MDQKSIAWQAMYLYNRLSGYYSDLLWFILCMLALSSRYSRHQFVICSKAAA